MALIIDRRDALGTQPGLHALIAGISAYPHLPGGGGKLTSDSDSFGIQQLTMAARTAFNIYRWLDSHYSNQRVPLATCRLLVSPSSIELDREPALAEVATPCTLENFLVAAAEWRDDASSNRENITILYLVGHSFERGSADQILLLEDFNNGIGATLRNTISISSIFNGMVPSTNRHELARTQLYFVDTGRAKPSPSLESRAWTATPVFDLELSTVDDRNAPIFYATSPGGLAYGIPGEGTLFSNAVLRCLDGDAAKPDSSGRWCITTLSLVNALPIALDAIVAPQGARQEVVVGGSIRDAVIHYLAEPPIVKVVIDIFPPDAAALTTISIADAEGTIVLHVPPRGISKPLEIQLPAGIYTSQFQWARREFKDQMRIFMALPPGANVRISAA